MGGWLTPISFLKMPTRTARTNAHASMAGGTARVAVVKCRTNVEAEILNTRLYRGVRSTSGVQRPIHTTPSLI